MYFYALLLVSILQNGDYVYTYFCIHIISTETVATFNDLKKFTF